MKFLKMGQSHTSHFSFRVQFCGLPSAPGNSVFDQRNTAVSADVRDERRPCRFAELFHCGQGLDENLADFRAAQISTRGQDEGTDLGGKQCLKFNRTVSNVFIFGEHDPTVFANLGQPFLISRVLPEKLIVSANYFARAAEHLGNNSATQAPINEKHPIRGCVH